MNFNLYWQLVKVALAENIAVLAETALRFLNLSQASLDIQHNPIDYEAELRTLQGLIQVKVVALLSDSDNSVKRAGHHIRQTERCVVWWNPPGGTPLVACPLLSFVANKQFSHHK